MYDIGIDFIQKLKKSNVSRNPDKTRIRFQELWRDATKAQKARVLEDAGVVRATIYRIYSTGAVSAKIVVAAAQSFNVSPYYIAGDSDQPGSYSLEAARAFLTELGYEKLVRTQLPQEEAVKTRKTRSLKPTPGENVEKHAPEIAPASDLSQIIPHDPVVSSRLGEEELILLLRALIIRSTVSADAKRALDGIISNLTA